MMPYMAPTEVMKLGRLQPMMRQGYLNPPRTSPSFPQNLLRQTIMNGVGKARMLSGLGAAPVEMPDQIAAGVAVEDYSRVGAPFPGQAVSAPTAPIGQTMIDGNGVVSPVGHLQDWGGRVSTQRGTLLGLVSLSLVSGVVSAVHGWGRDHTPIAAWGWFTLGSMFPLVTPLVAVTQGFGKRRRRGR